MHAKLMRILARQDVHQLGGATVSAATRFCGSDSARGVSAWFWFFFHTAHTPACVVSGLLHRLKKCSDTAANVFALRAVSGTARSVPTWRAVRTARSDFTLRAVL